MRGAYQRAWVGQRQVPAAYQYLAHPGQVLEVVDTPFAQGRVGGGQGGYQRLHADVLEATTGIDLQPGKGDAEVGAAAVQQVQGFFLRGTEQGDVQ